MRELFIENELREIFAKVEAGQRLSREDGLILMESKDLLTLGYLAGQVKERKNGNKVYFNHNRHINHTNICVNRCKLCAFGVDPVHPNAYLLTLEEIEAKAEEMVGKNISEIHIVGGLHPDLPFEYYLTMLIRIKKILPHVHIKAFTAVEIDYFAQTTGLALEEVFRKLQKAGLDSLPGGGAEIFSKGVRDLICEKKISGDRWLEVMKVAHNMGMRTNATMLYGHVETSEERIDHLIQLRELQDKTGGFMTFIPLAFHPQNTALESMNLTRTTGFEDLKVLAVARLMLDNFDHIKAYWVMIGPKLAQVSLAFGVDDLDGTVIEEKITHAAGADAGQALSKMQLAAMIKAAGFQPVERDTLYNIVQGDF
ncbi:MAG: aminofutalosine synthase MqnE [Clostridia bacterium]|nr:aminofutalosine synthase MqnE [Clostridia bacterium]